MLESLSDSSAVVEWSVIIIIIVVIIIVVIVIIIISVNLSQSSSAAENFKGKLDSTSLQSVYF